MKRIVLLRHGKSSWSDPDQDDLARPLNERGRLSSPLMAAWLEDHGLTPDLVWLSPARRCQETWERMAPVLGAKTETREERALYMASPSTQLEVLQSSPKGAKTVLMIGHQPGISSFTRKLADGKESESMSRAYRKFPTGSAATFEWDGDWADLNYGAAKFKNFVVPSEII